MRDMMGVKTNTFETGRCARKGRRTSTGENFEERKKGRKEERRKGRTRKEEEKRRRRRFKHMKRNSEVQKQEE
jgi:hypothetical protein